MFSVTVKGISLCFETEKSLFSPSAADLGTQHMLEHIEFGQEDKVLDLGCGYGLVGVYAAMHILPDNVYMTDIDPVAIRMTKVNLKLNGIEGVHVFSGNALEAMDQSGFTLIISNPPYHTDFSVAKSFIEKGFNRLALGGCLYMVSRRKDWYKNKIIAIFGGVQIWEADGYYIFMAQKRTIGYAR